MSETAFDKRERAEEEERLAMIKRLEKLVEKGKLSPSALEDVRKATSPDVHHAQGKFQGCFQGVEVSPGVFKDVPAELHRREEYVYAHTPTGTPAPKESEIERLTVPLHTDMGPGRRAGVQYSPGDQSIFALSGALAEPQAGRALPAHEAARLARIQAVAGEVPSVMGVKLAPPGLSPGRYMVWGSILGVAGAAALVALMVCTRTNLWFTTWIRAIYIMQGARLRRGRGALGERIANWFMPWRTSVTASRATRAELEAEQGEFVKRIKQRMVEGKA
ncbi:hypothetical protein COHA_006875 [Chlorella ohadii]|uniref:Uncharacterized protein n=1 Tax=Chlorella ohadii TaxID=2649997 RepID=A0AAD5DN40_9CHLO|nr:hypothetical protein COHA_006875 [Chlorella ohadii]